MYLLDTNVFIQAKNLHYGFDFCPAFWDWLIVQNSNGRVASVKKVADELFAGDDDLEKWAKSHKAFFLEPDSAMQGALEKVSEWADREHYQPSAVSTFLQIADYWLIAHAVAHDDTIVTHEIPADSMQKIKIPNVCIALELDCINPYEMLRRERARFILAP